MKVWVPTGDKLSAQVIQDFGVSPIPLSLGDVLAGLQTGLVDAVIVPPIVALALQWHNQVKYMLDVPIIYAYSTAMLDKRAFDSISPADQAVVRSVMNRIFSKIDRDNRKDNRAAYEALVNQGIKLTVPKPNQLEEWRKQAHQAVAGLIKSGQISQQSLDLLNKYLAEARQAAKSTSVAGD
jgi:TRAP-type C4-dicarboxylate transport system substrate-binding protein